MREALSILEHEGLIESAPYKGLMVKPVTVDEFLSMYEALGVIEPEIARKAALNASPADIRVMEASLAQAAKAMPDDIPGHLAACREFQARMGLCAHSPFLTRMLVSIEERSDMYLIHSRKALPPEKMQASIDDRRAMLDAIRAGDPDAAAVAAETHADGIRTRWRGRYPDIPASH